MGAMMTACKPDNDPINPNDSTPNNDNPPAMSGTVSVQFGDDVSWDAASFILSDQYADDYGILQFVAYKVPGDPASPSIQGYLPANLGTYSLYDTQNYYIFYYENDNDTTSSDGYSYPNWQPQIGDFTETLTALDLASHTLSATIDGTLYYLPDQLNDIATTKHLHVEFLSATWTPYSE